MYPKIFQYLVFYYPNFCVVPVSLFFVTGEPGAVWGLYFGDAGSGTFDEAYFRIDTSENGAGRFLECENPEDLAFGRDRVNQRRRRKVTLSPDDARAFEELRSYRKTWWTFEDGDRVLMNPARVQTMKVVAAPNGEMHEAPLLYARSRVLEEAIVDRVREKWSLRGL